MPGNPSSPADPPSCHRKLREIVRVAPTHPSPSAGPASRPCHMTPATFCASISVSVSPPSMLVKVFRRAVLFFCVFLLPQDGKCVCVCVARWVARLGCLLGFTSASWHTTNFDAFWSSPLLLLLWTWRVFNLNPAPVSVIRQKMARHVWCLILLKGFLFLFLNFCCSCGWRFGADWLVGWLVGGAISAAHFCWFCFCSRCFVRIQLKLSAGDCLSKILKT